MCSLTMSHGQLTQLGPMGPMNGGSQALFAVIILLLLAVIILQFYRQPKPSKPIIQDTAQERDTKSESGSEDKLEVALRLLDENERRVVEAIVAEGGSMLQKDISRDLDFSRVKTHRVVQSLAKRGLVTTEDHYNTVKVTLVDWLRQ